MLKLRITDFLVDGVVQTPRQPGQAYDYYVPESKSVKLLQQDGEFSFRFAALNYQLQHRVHYQYKLEGYDEDWQNAGKDRMATYSNLPSGTYQFQVKAFLLESPENYDMRTIEVVVPASFLLSTKAIWIYLILLTIIALTALWWYQQRMKNGNANGNGNGNVNGNRNESELTESGDVLSEDIKLDVDDTPYADVTEVGMFESEGDDSHLK